MGGLQTSLVQQNKLFSYAKDCTVFVAFNLPQPGFYGIRGEVRAKVGNKTQAAVYVLYGRDPDALWYLHRHARKVADVDISPSAAGLLHRMDGTQIGDFVPFRRGEVRMLGYRM